MVKDSGYIWDPWKRCPSPSVLTLNLPHEYKGHIYTAMRGGKWYYGYHCEVHNEAWIPVRAVGPGYETEREAKMAALTDFLEAVLHIRKDVDDEGVGIWDDWEEVCLMPCEELLGQIDDVCARLEEYREHYDEDAIFEFEETSK